MNAAAVDDLSRRLGWLLHVDEPARLRTYRAALREAAPALDAAARVRLQMLDYQLHPRGVMPAAEQTLETLRRHPEIRDELAQVADVLEQRIALAEERQPVAAWPLALHRHYTRREIVAAVGFVTPGAKGKLPQGGVLKLPPRAGEPRRELLFVTLDKSGKAFSPTTRYRDYAVSPQLFHWETQAAASVSRPSGRRYLEGAASDEAWQFYLFVRPDPEAAYAFLGRVHYQSHSGDRPISIVWRLEHAMPAALYDRYATLRQ